MLDIHFIRMNMTKVTHLYHFSCHEVVIVLNDASLHFLQQYLGTQVVKLTNLLDTYRLLFLASLVSCPPVIFFAGGMKKPS